MAGKSSGRMKPGGEGDSKSSQISCAAKEFVTLTLWQLLLVERSTAQNKWQSGLPLAESERKMTVETIDVGWNPIDITVRLVAQQDWTINIALEEDIPEGTTVVCNVSSWYTKAFTV